MRGIKSSLHDRFSANTYEYSKLLDKIDDFTKEETTFMSRLALNEETSRKSKNELDKQLLEKDKKSIQFQLQENRKKQQEAKEKVGKLQQEINQNKLIDSNQHTSFFFPLRLVANMIAEQKLQREKQNENRAIQFEEILNEAQKIMDGRADLILEEEIIIKFAKDMEPFRETYLQKRFMECALKKTRLIT